MFQTPFYKDRAELGGSRYLVDENGFVIMAETESHASGLHLGKTKTSLGRRGLYSVHIRADNVSKSMSWHFTDVRLESNQQFTAHI